MRNYFRVLLGAGALLMVCPGASAQSTMLTYSRGQNVAPAFEGWEQAAGAYAEQGAYRSVADVVDTASLEKVRAFKKEKKAAAKAEPKRKRA